MLRRRLPSTSLTSARFSSSLRFCSVVAPATSSPTNGDDHHHHHPHHIPITIEPTDIKKAPFFRSTDSLKINDLVHLSRRNGMSDEEAGGDIVDHHQQGGQPPPDTTSRNCYASKDALLKKLITHFNKGVASYITTQQDCLENILKSCITIKNKDNENSSSALSSQRERVIDKILKEHKDRLQNLVHGPACSSSSTIIPPLSLLAKGNTQNILFSLTDSISGGFHLLNGHFVLDRDTNNFLSNKLSKITNKRTNEQGENEEDSTASSSSSSSSLRIPSWFFARSVYSSSASSPQSLSSYSFSSSSTSSISESRLERQLFTPKSHADEVLNTTIIPFNTRILIHAPFRYQAKFVSGSSSQHQSSDENSTAATTTSHNDAKNLGGEAEIDHNHQTEPETSFSSSVKNKKQRHQQNSRFGSNKIGVQKYPSVLHESQVSLAPCSSFMLTMMNNDESDASPFFSSASFNKNQEQCFNMLYDTLHARFNETLSVLHQFEEEWKVIAAFVSDKSQKYIPSSSSNKEGKQKEGDDEQQEDKKRKHHIRSFLKGNLTPAMAQHHVLVKLGGYFSRQSVFSVDPKTIDQLNDEKSEARACVRSIFPPSFSSSSSSSEKAVSSSEQEIDEQTQENHHNLVRIITPLTWNWLLELADVAYRTRKVIPTSSSSSSEGTFESSNDHERETAFNHKRADFRRVNNEMRNNYKFTSQFCVWELSSSSSFHDDKNSFTLPIKSSLIRPLWSLSELTDEAETTANLLSNDGDKDENSNVLSSPSPKTTTTYYVRRVPHYLSTIDKEPVLRQIYFCLDHTTKLQKQKLMNEQEESEQQHQKEIVTSKKSNITSNFFNPFVNFRSSVHRLHHASAKTDLVGDDDEGTSATSSMTNNKKNYTKKAGNVLQHFIYKHKTFQGKPIHVSIAQFLEKAVQQRKIARTQAWKEKQNQQQQNDDEQKQQQEEIAANNTDTSPTTDDQISSFSFSSSSPKLSDWTPRVWWPCRVLQARKKRVRTGADVVQVLVSSTNSAKRNNNNNHRRQDRGAVVISFANDVDVEDDPHA